MFRAVLKALAGSWIASNFAELQPELRSLDAGVASGGLACFTPPPCRLTHGKRAKSVQLPLSILGFHIAVYIK